MAIKALQKMKLLWAQHPTEAEKVVNDWLELPENRDIVIADRLLAMSGVAIVLMVFYHEHAPS